ncbi:unnamed protein product [Candidula unifasciata]|uniref:Protein inturned n=1 Tax=Candidula unifasciata TaxID=100452 RepID=A0A8S3Z188_9EUPU|nr:unnamed protein product [Candidula unifasciata]
MLAHNCLQKPAPNPICLSFFRFENINGYNYHLKKHLATGSGHRKHKGSGSNGQYNCENELNQTDQCGNSYKNHGGPLDSSDNEFITPRTGMRQKTKQLSVLNNNRKDPADMQLQTTEAVLVSKETPADTDSAMHVKKHEMESTFSEKRRSLKHVSLAPNHHSLSGNESSGVELCRKLFGIIVLEYANDKAPWNYGSKERKLVVQGVMEASPAYTSGRIHRGDMVIKVNDVDVSWLNFTRLLKSLSKRKRVKLTLQSPRIIGPKPSYCVLEVTGSDLCLAVTGKRLSDIQSELSSLSCVVLYLTLVRSPEGAESDSKEDVIYTFPPEEQTLTALRGLFLTLSSLLVDVVDQPASCTKLVLSEVPVNVVYKQFGKDVLVFAMPDSRISSVDLAACLDAFCSLMVLLFSDVQCAFSDCDRNWLDRVLALVFSETLRLVCQSSSHKMVSAVTDYHTVKMLNLSYDNKLICDEILTEFEAMDFDDFLDSKDLFSRRKYTVQGTSLFYKEYLVTSHVPCEQQRNINLFMNCHGLLALSSRQHVTQVMVWQEVKSRTSPDASLLSAGYRPNQTRSFLMIVGLKHYYLAAVIEAGGCSRWIHGQASPLPLLVDQGKATLAQLETEEVHMSQCCEERLIDTSKSVSLASADELCRLMSPRNRDIFAGVNDTLTPTISFPKSPFSRTKSVDRMDDRSDAGSTAFIKRQGSKLSYGSNDSAGSGSSAGLSKSKGSRFSSAADLPGISRSVSYLQINAPHDVLGKRRLERGNESTLFTFLHLDSAEGILITPTEAEIMDVHSSLQQQVIDNFSSCCRKMRTLFRNQVTIIL